jgi:hypothetical protein
MRPPIDGRSLATSRSLSLEGSGGAFKGRLPERRSDRASGSRADVPAEVSSAVSQSFSASGGLASIPLVPPPTDLPNNLREEAILV